MLKPRRSTKICGIILSVLIFVSATDAFAKKIPSQALTRPGGLGGALLGGGTAFNSDLSALDTNPAGISLYEDVNLGGEFFWQKQNALASEAGIIDSKMTRLSAGFKFRQSTNATGGADRRYTLGFAGRPGEYPFLLGIAGDYMELKSYYPSGKEKKEEDSGVRVGAIYQYSQDLQFGLKSAGYFESQDVLTHTLGAALGFASNYVGSLDLNVIDNTFRTAILGVTVLAKGYLDLSVSYGYDLKERISSGAFGVVVKSDIIRIFYTLSRSDFGESIIDHSAGARVSLQF